MCVVQGLVGELLASDFMPHGHCFRWIPELVALHAVSNALIAAAYFAIPLSLVHFIARRRDVEFRWMFGLFGVFIFMCGLTHVAEVWSIWNGTYWATGSLKLATGIVSALTAAMLIPVVPKALSFPSQEQLRRAYDELTQEVAARRRAEDELRLLNDELEARVSSRTSELRAALERLQVESAERARGEARLQTTADRLQAILDILPVGVFIADRDGQLLETNEAARQIWGGETPLVDAARYNTYTARWPSTGRLLNASDWALARALKGEHVAEPQDVEIETFGGTRKRILNYAIPLVQNGQIDGAVAVSVDATALRQTEAALLELNATLEARVAERTAELDRRNHELQSFAFLASHDLQEPLRKVRTFADLVRSEYGDQLPEEATRYLSRIEDAAARMSMLLTDLLDYSRVVGRPGAFERFEISDVTTEVLHDVEMLVEKTGAVIEVEGDVELEADRSQIRQLLNHLVLNAIKFQDDASTPRITLTVRSEDKYHCRLEVVDNGIGFDAQYAERIFRPFERLHGRSRYPGTGMGLAICHRIVERHGGTITAHSEPGVGSRFVIVLPRRQRAE